MPPHLTDQVRRATEALAIYVAENAGFIRLQWHKTLRAFPAGGAPRMVLAITKTAAGATCTPTVWDQPGIQVGLLNRPEVRHAVEAILSEPDRFPMLVAYAPEAVPAPGVDPLLCLSLPVYPEAPPAAA